MSPEERLAAVSAVMIVLARALVGARVIAAPALHSALQAMRVEIATKGASTGTLGAFDWYVNAIPRPHPGEAL